MCLIVMCRCIDRALRVDVEIGLHVPHRIISLFDPQNVVLQRT